MRHVIGRSRASTMNTLRAAMLGTVCMVCGLLAGYQAYKSGHNKAGIRLKMSSSAASRPDNFPIDKAHVRQQYRYLQPGNISAISMHTVVPTGCDRWQDFQMAGLYWSFLRYLFSMLQDIVSPAAVRLQLLSIAMLP